MRVSIDNVVNKVVKNPALVGLILMLFFGFIFTIIIRPLDIPDEPNHFVRAYEIADGNWFSATESTGGSCHAERGNINQNERDSTDRGISLPKSVQDFTSMQGANFSRSQQLTVDLNQGQRVDTCLRQTNANSPMGYIPQSFAIWVLKIFDAPPILMLYAARIAILVTWSLLIYFAIKIIPTRKWAFVGIALIPLAVQQSISIGADVLSIAPAVLVTAIVVRSRFADRSRYFKKDIAAIALLATVAVLAKPVMVLLAIPILLYKINTATGTKKYFGLSRRRVAIIGAVIIPLVMYGIWALIAKFSQVSVNDIFVLAAEKSEHGFISLIPSFIGQTIEFAMSGLSVQQFGSLLWFTNTMPELWSYIGILILCVYLFVGYENGKRVNEASKQTLFVTCLFYLTALGMICANILTLYIIWTPIEGATTIEGVQFRYFLPAFFVIAAIYGRRYINASERWFVVVTLTASVVFFILSVLTLLNFFK